MSDRGWSPSGATPAFRSLLYRQPWLYDLVFPDHDDTTGRMVRTAIRRYLPGVPRSMLDVGCGTGRLLETLASAEIRISPGDRPEIRRLTCSEPRARLMRCPKVSVSSIEIIASGASASAAGGARTIRATAPGRLRDVPW